MTLRDVAILTAASALVLLPNLGQNHRWEGREILHAEVAREMAASGNYAIARRLGSDYVDKPPILHAAVAFLLARTSSPSMWVARLPTALAAWLGVLATYALGRVLLDRRTALGAALLLAGMPYYILMGRIVRPDMLFASLIAVSSALLCLGMAARSQAARVPLFAFAGLAAGLATVTKGPFGALFPYLVILVAPLGKRDLVRPRWLDLHALALAFASGIALWLVPAIEREGLGYILAVVRQRDMTTGASGWSRPAWWYLGPLFTVTLPAGALLPLAAFRALKGKASVALAMVALMVVSLSLVPGKRNYYLLPAFPFLALVAAEAIGLLATTRPWVLRVARGGVLLGAVGILAYYAAILPLAYPGGNAEYRFAREIVSRVSDRTPIVCLEMGEEVAWVGDRDLVYDAYHPATAAGLVANFGPGAILVVGSKRRDELVGLLPPGDLALLFEFDEEDDDELWYVYEYRGVENRDPARENPRSKVDGGR